MTEAEQGTPHEEKPKLPIQLLMEYRLARLLWINSVAVTHKDSSSAQSKLLSKALFSTREDLLAMGVDPATIKPRRPSSNIEHKG